MYYLLLTFSLGTSFAIDVLGPYDRKICHEMEMGFSDMKKPYPYSIRGEIIKAVCVYGDASILEHQTPKGRT